MFNWITKIILSIAVFLGVSSPVALPTPEPIQQIISAIASPTASPTPTKLTPTHTPQTINISTPIPVVVRATPTPLLADFCRNIALNQSLVPLGMYRTVDGDCFIMPTETPTPTPTPIPTPTPTPTPIPTATPTPTPVPERFTYERGPYNENLLTVYNATNTTQTIKQVNLTFNKQSCQAYNGDNFVVMREFMGSELYGEWRYSISDIEFKDGSYLIKILVNRQVQSGQSKRFDLYQFLTSSQGCTNSGLYPAAVIL